MKEGNKMSMRFEEIPGLRPAILLSGALAALPWAFVQAAEQVQSSLVFPRLGRTAQSLALGDAGATLEGLNALGVNPAGLSTKSVELLTQYQSLPLNTDLALAGVALPLPSLRTTLAGTYLGHRSRGFDRRNKFGEPEGEFAVQDSMMGLHFSHDFPMEDKNPLSLGLGLKFLKMGIADRKASSFAMDLGARYSFQTLPLSLGLSFLNIGRGPVFIQEESKLPTSLSGSLALGLFGPLTLVGSATSILPESRTDFSFGLQYQMAGVMALRGRYALAAGGPAAGGTGLDNLAAGFGINLAGHSLDYGFQAFDRGLREAGAAGTHRLTLTFRLSDPADRVAVQAAETREAKEEPEPEIYAEKEKKRLERKSRKKGRKGQALDYLIGW